mgnify:FL=1
MAKPASPATLKMYAYLEQHGDQKISVASPSLPGIEQSKFDMAKFQWKKNRNKTNTATVVTKIPKKVVAKLPPRRRVAPVAVVAKKGPSIHAAIQYVHDNGGVDAVVAKLKQRQADLARDQKFLDQVLQFVATKKKAG